MPAADVMDLLMSLGELQTKHEKLVYMTLPYTMERDPNVTEKQCISLDKKVRLLTNVCLEKLECFYKSPRDMDMASYREVSQAHSRVRDVFKSPREFPK